MVKYSTRLIYIILTMTLGQVWKFSLNVLKNKTSI